MSKSQQGLLTLGAFIIIVAIAVILGAALNIWSEVVPLIIAFYGCWLVVVAGMRTRNPSKYPRSAFSFFGWGILIAAIGFGSYLSIDGIIYWVYAFAVVLLILGILGVVAALKTTKKKA